MFHAMVVAMVLQQYLQQAELLAIPIHGRHQAELELQQVDLQRESIM